MKKVAAIVGFVLVSSVAQAGLFDGIATVFGGHVNDLTSRFAADQFVEGTTIATTRFRENDRGQDALHHGSGSVSIVETAEGRFLQFGADFSSTPGPDYHVYISQDGKVDHEERFVASNQIELGRLVKGSGASHYKLPENVDFTSVTVWCKAFGEFIVSADFVA